MYPINCPQYATSWDIYYLPACAQELFTKAQELVRIKNIVYRQGSIDSANAALINTIVARLFQIVPTNLYNNNSLNMNLYSSIFAIVQAITTIQTLLPPQQYHPTYGESCIYLSMNQINREDLGKLINKCNQLGRLL